MNCWVSWFLIGLQGYTVNVVKKEPVKIKQLHILISCWDWWKTHLKNWHERKEVSLATSERLEGHWWQEGGIREEQDTTKEGNLVHLRRPLDKAPYKTHSEANKEEEGSFSALYFCPGCNCENSSRNRWDAWLSWASVTLYPWRGVL